MANGMKRFSFNLQKLLQLREFEEKNAKPALAAAVSEAERIKNELKSIAVERVRVNKTRNENVDTLFLITLEHYVNRLDVRKEELLEKAGAVVIKLSPMLDWHRAVDELNRMGEVVREVHIVSVRNECKELLLVLRKGTGPAANVPADGLRMFCVNDDSIVSYGLGEVSGLSQHILPAAPAAGQYLYEPNASLMKAGCFALLTARYPLSALGQNTHLFVSYEDITAFPGRKFVITAVSSFNKKELRRTLSGIDRANLSVRNFPMSVADLRRRMKMKEGGETYLFAATDAHGSHLLFVCRKI